jgi:hypothetical protein
VFSAGNLHAAQGAAVLALAAVIPLCSPSSMTASCAHFAPHLRACRSAGVWSAVQSVPQEVQTGTCTMPPVSRSSSRSMPGALAAAKTSAPCESGFCWCQQAGATQEPWTAEPSRAHPCGCSCSCTCPVSTSLQYMRINQGTDPVDDGCIGLTGSVTTSCLIHASPLFVVAAAAAVAVLPGVAPTGPAQRARARARDWGTAAEAG